MRDNNKNMRDNKKQKDASSFESVTSHWVVLPPQAASSSETPTPSSGLRSWQNQSSLCFDSYWRIMLESWFLLDRLKNETHFKTAEARVRCSLSDQVSIGVCFSFRRCWTPDILSSSELNGSPQSSLLFGEKHRTLQPVNWSALLSCVCRLICSPSRLCLATAYWETMKQPRVLWSWETWSGLQMTMAELRKGLVVHFDGVSERPCKACPSHSLLHLLQLQVVGETVFFSPKLPDLWRY